jgi:zeaxanthin glucosyltransferase
VGLPSVWLVAAAKSARLRRLLLDARSYNAGRQPLSNGLGATHAAHSRRFILADWTDLPNDSRVRFPRTLPANFFYTGLLFDESRLQIDPPLQNPNGEPLVYASLGTILNQDPAIYRHIADACSTLDVQLVISLGGGQVDQLGDLSRNTIVVKYVPQYEMLKKAVLVVTHAGLNTVQEALHLGVPMVAIPITNDQPAVAARLRHCGAGEVVPVSKLTGTKLREAITKVIQDDTYRKAAQKQRDAILKAGGVQRAAEIVEMVLNLNRTAKLAAHI